MRTATAVAVSPWNVAPPAVVPSPEALAKAIFAPFGAAARATTVVFAKEIKYVVLSTKPLGVEVAFPA